MRKIFCLMLAGYLALASVAHAEVTVGQPTPALVAQELDGKTFDLTTMKGKVVVLHFWATWCPSCKEEMPALDAFAKSHPDAIVMVISADKSRQRDKVVDAMKMFSFQGAMLSDVSDNGFGTPSSIPVTYIIDKQGMVRNEMSPDQGVLTAQSLDAAVKSLR
ncbi:MAG TPA: TlpA disulfide reductase family protein [Alphaproteobacteria bacterium]|nr:TlpA disulfide reductase family protein [Alphaproteobacteria bacterium]